MFSCHLLILQHMQASGHPLNEWRSFCAKQPASKKKNFLVSSEFLVPASSLDVSEASSPWLADLCILLCGFLYNPLLAGV